MLDEKDSADKFPKGGFEVFVFIVDKIILVTMILWIIVIYTDGVPNPPYAVAQPIAIYGAWLITMVLAVMGKRYL